METLLNANTPATTRHPAPVEAHTVNTPKAEPTWAPRTCQHCGANARSVWENAQFTTFSIDPTHSTTLCNTCFYKWLDGGLEMTNQKIKILNS